MTLGANDRPLVNAATYAQARAELGANFIRILGYFREDGVKSLDLIETAMRGGIAAAMVIPAHTLKGEAAQFGADRLAEIAEAIELIARDCVETHDSPDEALAHVVQLRPVFESTLAMLEREANPLMARKPFGMGRRATV